jgi:hypothetical protein
MVSKLVLLVVVVSRKLDLRNQSSLALLNQLQAWLCSCNCRCRPPPAPVDPWICPPQIVSRGSGFCAFGCVDQPPADHSSWGVQVERGSLSLEGWEPMRPAPPPAFPYLGDDDVESIDRFLLESQPSSPHHEDLHFECEYLYNPQPSTLESALNSILSVYSDLDVGCDSITNDLSCV